MVSGKERRMRRLLGADGKALFVAVDHSLTTGPTDGLSDMRATLQAIVSGGADAIIAHRGTAARDMPPQRETGLVIHLSGNTRLSNESDLKIRVCDPETAAALGADAVSAHLTFSGDHREDREALADLGRIARSCDRLGLPLLVMTYTRITTEDRAAATLHAARAASELGADIVKVAHPGEKHLHGLAAMLTIPVVIAGGEANDDWDNFLKSARTIMAAGVAGLCVGRRIFTQADPARATAALRAAVHGEAQKAKRFSIRI
jgi:DhnA family fructose-bisphosphate aldolase class Ia